MTETINNKQFIFQGATILPTHLWFLTVFRIKPCPIQTFKKPISHKLMFKYTFRCPSDRFTCRYFRGDLGLPNTNTGNLLRAVKKLLVLYHHPAFTSPWQSSTLWGHLGYLGRIIWNNQKTLWSKTLRRNYWNKIFSFWQVVSSQHGLS